MSASPVHRQKHATKCVTVLSPFLRHLNTGTLAFVMFVALPFLSSTHGKNPETKESIPSKATKTDVVIDNFIFSPPTITVPVGATVTWTNHDNVAHTVTSADNQFKKSPVLKAGGALLQHLRDRRNLLLLLFHSPSDDRKDHRQVTPTNSI